MKALTAVLMLALPWPLRAADVAPLDTGTVDAQTSDHMRMQGRWSVVRFEQDGADELKAMLGGKAGAVYRFLFEKERLTIRLEHTIDGKQVSEKEEAFVVRMNASKAPRTLDLVEGPKNPGKIAAACIYRFEGDQLEICFRNDEKKPPLDFKGKAGDGLRRIVLKKATP